MGVDFQGLSKNYSNQTTILKHFWFFQIYTQMIPNVYWKLFQQKPFKQKKTPIEVVKRHNNLLIYSN